MQAQNRTVVELDNKGRVTVYREWFVRPGQWKLTFRARPNEHIVSEWLPNATFAQEVQP